FFSSRRRHTRSKRDWSSDVCSSDLPFFAAPRTATVAYEVGFQSFIGDGNQQVGLFVFSLIFFAVTLLFSLKPTRIVDNVGKILAPGIVILLAILLTMV